jgi:hypothetical protein
LKFNKKSIFNYSIHPIELVSDQLLKTCPMLGFTVQNSKMSTQCDVCVCVCVCAVYERFIWCASASFVSIIYVGQLYSDVNFLKSLKMLLWHIKSPRNLNPPFVWPIEKDIRNHVIEEAKICWILLETKIDFISLLHWAKTIVVVTLQKKT